MMDTFANCAGFRATQTQSSVAHLVTLQVGPQAASMAQPVRRRLTDLSPIFAQALIGLPHLTAPTPIFDKLLGTERDQHCQSQ